MQLGELDALDGTGFDAGASYELSSDVGVLHVQDSAASVVTADSTGSFRVLFTVTAATALATVTVRVSTIGDPAALASTSIAIEPARLRIPFDDGSCPGFGSPIDTTGLPDGDYLLSTNAGTISPSGPLTAVDGALPTAQLTLSGAPPADLTVTATAVGTDTPAATFTRKLGPATGSVVRLSPRSISMRAACFDAGEAISIALPPGVAGPHQLSADSGGSVRFSVQPHPSTLEADLGSVTLTGQVSGLVLRQPLGIEPGSTLRAGEAISDVGQLASVWDDYYLSYDGGELSMISYGSAGSTIDWSAGTHTLLPQTQLRMQSDGDLTVYSLSQHRILWSAGTRGTGAHNRLVIQPYGNAVIFNAANQLLWSSKIGLYRGANGILSEASIQGWRSQVPGSHDTVLIDGEFGQKGPDINWHGSPHRVAYLQRYLNGHWQNLLVRTSGPDGSVSARFIAPRACNYRWYLLGTATLAGAISPSLPR